MSGRPADHPRALDAGAYVLGALRGAEREDFERHLRSCAVCRQAVAEVADLPGVLATVPADVVASLAEDVGTGASDGTGPSDGASPPSTLLQAVLERIRAEEGRRRRRRAGVAALAAAAVVALVVVLGPGLVGTRSTPVEPPAAQAVVLAPTGEDIGVTAVVRLEPVAWGTRISVTCTHTGGDATDGAGGYEDGSGGGDGAGGYGSDGGEYALVLERADGTSEQVATWRGVPGRDVVVPTGTGARPEEIVRIDLRSADGRSLLSSER